MDIISHALWTNLVFKEVGTSVKWWAVLFSVLPDLISFIFIFGRGFWQRVLHYTDPPLKKFPPIVFKFYNVTHSLAIWGIAYIVLRTFGLEAAALAWCGWSFHILLDIPTHAKKYLATPFLWPFSRLKFDGIHWSDKGFMLFNYTVLLFLYLVFYFD